MCWKEEGRQAWEMMIVKQQVLCEIKQHRNWSDSWIWFRWWSYRFLLFILQGNKTLKQVLQKAASDPEALVLSRRTRRRCNEWTEAVHSLASSCYSFIINNIMQFCSKNFYFDKTNSFCEREKDLQWVSCFCLVSSSCFSFSFAFLPRCNYILGRMINRSLTRME